MIAALVAGGLMDGFNRVIVDTPSWERLGAQAWASYSRHSDLGNATIVYTIEAISWTPPAIAAAVTFRLDRASRRSAGPPIYATALLMIIVMTLTVKAAPIMLGVDDLGNDWVGMQKAFEEFIFWGVQVRGAFLTLASSQRLGPRRTQPAMIDAVISICRQENADRSTMRAQCDKIAG